MAGDDDILMGSQPVRGGEARDSDGDGVSDVQERLDGTDPADASDRVAREPTLNPLGGDDPRADLDGVILERELAVDVAAMTPDGMTVETGLAGLTNLDGSAVATGPSGPDLPFGTTMAGHGGGVSPLDMQRDPLAPTGTTPGGTPQSGTTSGGPPPGLGASGSAGGRNMDLVSDKTGGGSSWDPDRPFSSGVRMAEDVAVAAWNEFSAAVNEPIDWVVDALKPDEPDDLLVPPPPRTPKDTDEEEEAGPAPRDEEEDEEDMSDPDADTGAAPTAEEIERAVVRAGADTDFVEGYGEGVQTQDTPPEGGRHPLVTDPGEGDDLSDATTSGPFVPPGTEVSQPVNPRDIPGGGIPGGGGAGGGGGQGGGDDLGLSSGSGAATAASAGEPGVPGISVVGSGGGGSGVQSVAASEGDDVLGTAPAAAVVPPATGRVPDPGPTAVDAVTAPAVDVAPVSAPDLVAAGLVADLGADPAPAPADDTSVTLVDPGGTHGLEGSLPDEDGIDG